MTRTLRAGRLELVRATREILAADLSDRTCLARLLNAVIPAALPPPHMDENVLRGFIRMETATDGRLFAAWYRVRDGEGAEGRTLIGNGGIIGAEGRQDTVVLGYPVLDAFRNRGYATEAVQALIPEIFCILGVERIIATTCPDLAASIRVLGKCGFVRTDPAAAGTGAGEGNPCYAREREKRPLPERVPLENPYLPVVLTVLIHAGKRS